MPRLSRHDVCRAAFAAVTLGLVAGCNTEPDFDERFSDAQAKIDKTAQSIEDDLEAEQAEGEVTLAPPIKPGKATELE